MKMKSNNKKKEVVRKISKLIYLLIATCYLLTVSGCANPFFPEKKVRGGGSTPVTTEQLEELVNEAEDVRVGVEISPDGTDVGKGDRWVSQEDWDALQDAINDAEDAIAKGEKDLDEIYDELKKAIEEFERAKRRGTRPATTQEIQVLVGEAEDVKGGIVTSEDGSELNEDEWWVTQEDLDALEEAINKAEDAINKGETDLDDIYDEIEQAIEDFENAKKPGGKPVPILSLSSVVFKVVEYGYEQPEEITITITNSGSLAATVSDIVLGGINAGSFELSGQTEFTTVTAKGNASIKIQPKTGLSAGIYNVAITVNYDEDRKAETNIVFHVDKATPVINWPTGLTATAGQTLARVSFGDKVSSTPSGNFAWTELPTTPVGAVKPDEKSIVYSHNMVFTPSDTANYYIEETVTENIGITVYFIEIVGIESGTFQMGDYDFYPVHQVTLTKDFNMGKYEVTQDQYFAVMENNPSSFTSSPETGETQGMHPVENVSWYDAIEFCNALSLLEGLIPAYNIDKENQDPDNNNDEYDELKWTVTLIEDSTGYRLPTEAQWEYACRAGSDTLYFWGNDSTETGDYTWYYYNSGDNGTARKTHEVGLKKPNNFGLYDMTGNVLEWCWDWYAGYTNTEKEDPVGAPSGSYRVIRGGGYASNGYPRSAYRFHNNGPNNWGNSLGFRVLRP